MSQLRPDLSAASRSATDELLNASTHALGLVIAVIGALVMTLRVFDIGNAWLVASCGVYMTSLVAMYAMSTLSHSSTSPKWRSLFRRLDQAFIYILIVATYTPFFLAYLRGNAWWMLLGAMWVVALVGFAAKVCFAHRVEAVSITSYVVLGWMPVIAVPALWRAAPTAAIVSMIAGGLCYTVGTLFLVNDERVRHFHAAWHLFVIAGSACHFFGIW
jgi:hemolysin III